MISDANQFRGDGMRPMLAKEIRILFSEGQAAVGIQAGESRKPRVSKAGAAVMAGDSQRF